MATKSTKPKKNEALPVIDDMDSLPESEIAEFIDGIGEKPEQPQEAKQEDVK